MITTKQRSYLRRLANKEESLFQIGKNGISENTLIQFNSALEAREIVKGSVLNNSIFSAREACEEIADKTNSEIVQVIGNKFVVYRESNKKKKINLPK